MFPAPRSSLISRLEHTPIIQFPASQVAVVIGAGVEEFPACLESKAGTIEVGDGFR